MTLYFKISLTLNEKSIGYHPQTFTTKNGLNFHLILGVSIDKLSPLQHFYVL